MTEINIEGFKNQLGANYWLVKTIWNRICKEGFYIQCADHLEDHEHPLGECTDLEKILVTCITYLEYIQEKENIENMVTLTQKTLEIIHETHKIEEAINIKIKGCFFIVITT